MSYKAGIIAAITELKDRAGSSSVAIKKHMQANLPKDKKWLNGMFLNALKKAVADGDLVQVKNSYKLSADFKKKAKAASEPKKKALPKKKITGLQNDLRKLTMKQTASLLRSYGMNDNQIGVLKRWDRVHVISDLSTKAASDGMKKATPKKKKTAPKKKKTAPKKKFAPKKKATTAKKSAMKKKAATKKKSATKNKTATKKKATKK